MKKDIKEIIRGARCCLDPDDNCERCPYAAAGEDCGHELDADLVRTAEESAHLQDWMVRALVWLGREEPDALIAMVDGIGEYIPEALRCRVFGNDQERA